MPSVDDSFFWLGLSDRDGVHDNRRRFVMARRRKMSRRGSRKNFRSGAKRIKTKNVRGRPMRGGIRL